MPTGSKTSPRVDKVAKPMTGLIGAAPGRARGHRRAEQRDVKRRYRKARAGELANVTGIDCPHDAPRAPELHIDTTALRAGEAAESIVQRIVQQ